MILPSPPVVLWFCWSVHVVLMVSHTISDAVTLILLMTQIYLKYSYSPRYKQHEGLTMTTVTRIATPGGLFPVTVGAFQTPRRHRGPLVMTVTGIVTLGGSIPVTVRTFETRRQHEEQKVMTATRMAAFRHQKR